MSDVLIPVEVVEPERVVYWADRVSSDLKRSVESIIAAGLDLIEAQAELGDVGLRKVAEVVGIGKSQTYYLVQIARHPVLSTRVEDLPSSWRALAELAQAEPEVVEQWLEDGVLGPTTTVQAAHDLVKAAKAPAADVDPDEGETAADPEKAPKTGREFAEDRDAAVFSVEQGASKAHRLEDAVQLITAPGFRLNVGVADDILRALRPLEDARAKLLEALEDEVGTLIDIPPYSPPRRIIPIADPRDPQQVAGTESFEGRQAPHSAV